MTAGEGNAPNTASVGRRVPVSERLTAHLQNWLGAWPPQVPIQVVGSASRALPGWDGHIRKVIGVANPDGAIISVPLELAATLDPFPLDLQTLAASLEESLHVRGGQFGQGIFRWSTAPESLPPAGVWLPATDDRLPEWLRPFGGEALVALDAQDRYMAGVGVKRHDVFGHEIAVGTDPAYQGMGLARRLVAQAARHIIANGAVPTYLHDPRNLASAHVADASGFPDRGWRIVVFWSEGDPLPG